jgi:inosine-uridine nucleoside N-ribohydrolase
MAFKLASKYNYHLKLITTVFGNCCLKQVIKNVAKIRKACGYDMNTGPLISPGCSTPLRPETMIDATYFHGYDGLGNNNYLDDESGVILLKDDEEEEEKKQKEGTSTHHDDDDAAKQIIQLCLQCKEKNEKIKLVMLGPLTNLARAIQLQDDLVTYIDSLVIMGGCGNGHGNVYRTTEFNITADCEAAAIVFDNLSKYKKVCTLVSWELTLANTIPWEIFDRMNQGPSPVQGQSSVEGLSTTVVGLTTVESPSANEGPSAANEGPDVEGLSPDQGPSTSSPLIPIPTIISKFLYSISQFSYHPNKRIPIPHYSLVSEHFHGAVICDLLAVAIAINSEELILAQTLVNVEIELEGKLTRGQTVVDWGCYDGIHREKNCNWIMEVKQERVIEMFMTMYEEGGGRGRDGGWSEIKKFPHDHVLFEGVVI